MKEETIETYIQKFPENIQEILKRVREIILSCNTELEETIKYGIPTFILHGNLVHFAAYKKHLGFYPDPSGVEAFKDKLEVYTISKGGIQFLYTESIPYDLIAEITLFRVKENIEKAQKKSV